MFLCRIKPQIQEYDSEEEYCSQNELQYRNVCEDSGDDNHIDGEPSNKSHEETEYIDSSDDEVEITQLQKR